MKYLPILFAVCLMAACAKPAKDANTNEPSPNETEQQPETETETKKAPGKLEEADAPEQVRAVQKIEDVTGLKFKQKVPVYVYTPEELEEEVKGWGDGFVPDNILGFYKWTTKSLYMVPEAAGNKRAFGLRIHEAVHALQDQYWGLEKLHGGVETTDGDYGVLGLIEGHAVQVMIDALIEDQPHVAYISKAAAPEGSMKPSEYRSVYTYAQGTRFIQHLKDLGGYERVHQAFEDPPVSSEQILHPELYAPERDDPDVIELDMSALQAALSVGWELGTPDTVGEFETQMVFVQHKATNTLAASAAAGWGGDTLIEANNGEQRLMLWVTTWDSESDAEEFFEAISDVPDKLHAVWSKDEGTRVVYVVRGDAELTAEEMVEVVEALQKSVIELK